MKTQKICVLGGTGFVGIWLVHKLHEAGHRLIVPSRHPQRRRDLLVMPRVQLLQADVHDVARLTELLAGCDTVINLVGILNESGRDGAGFRRAHVELPEKIVEACRATGVRRVLHMSALRASASRGPSHYLRTKGEGEELLHAAAGLEVTSFRPSVIFGPRDSFFNRFAQLLAWSPLVFPLACPESRFAPVYIDDIADAFVFALNNPATVGQGYDICGPKSYTLRELVQYTAHLRGLKRMVIGLPDFAARWQARILGLLPIPPFSLDNYLSLQVESTCAPPFPALFGIQPKAVETIVPGYLGNERERARYQSYRTIARRT